MARTATAVYQSQQTAGQSHSRPTSAGRLRLASSYPAPAASRAAFIPHIIESIIAAADLPTQATCLRVSRMFYSVAGPRVYRCVTLDDDSAWSLLRGSLRSGKRSGTDKRPRPQLPGNQRQQVLLDTLGWFAPGRNLKARLLSHVKVLTLGSHDAALCGLASYLAPLFTGVQVLRLAPNIHPNHEHTLRQVCDGGLGTDMCELQNGLDPRKLVFRNVDAECLLYSPGKEWNGALLDTVVYFYPIDTRRYLHKGWASIAPHFSDVKSFKVVFWPAWEPVDPAARKPLAPVPPDHIVMPFKQLVQERPRETCMDCMHDLMAELDEEDSDYEDDVNRIIHQATKCQCLPYHAASVTIYGLEQVPWERSGEVYTTWRALLPGAADSQKDIAAMVEEEIRSSLVGRTYAARIASREVPPPPPVNVTFQSIEEYLVNCAREAEVDPWD